MHQHEPIPRARRQAKDKRAKGARSEMVDPRPVVTKRDIVRCVALEGALTYNEAQAMVSAIFEVIYDEIMETRSVKLARLGKITVIMQESAMSNGKKPPPISYMRLTLDYRQKNYVNQLAEKMGKEIAGLTVENINGFPVTRIDPELYPRLGVFRPGLQDNISTAKGRSSLHLLRAVLLRQQEKAKRRLGIEEDPIEKQRKAVERDLFYRDNKREWTGGFRTMSWRFINGERPKSIQEIFDRHDAHDSDGRFRDQARQCRRGAWARETTE